MIKIPLTQDQIAYVDDEYEHLLNYKWYARKSKNTYYAGRTILFNRKVHMHIEIMEEHLGRKLVKGEEVDHKDGNGLNNCLNNLRIATHQQNLQNIHSKKKSSSIYKGVYYNKARNKWAANIVINSKTKSLGLFVYEEEAARAYDRAAVYFFGEFASLNFPNEINIRIKEIKSYEYSWMV